MTLTIGDPAPTFELPDTDGTRTARSTATARPPPSSSSPATTARTRWPGTTAWLDVARDYADRGVRVLKINPNDAERYPRDSYEAMQQRVRDDGGWPMPYLHDERQDVARAYGARTTPDVFVSAPTARSPTAAPPTPTTATRAWTPRGCARRSTTCSPAARSGAPRPTPSAARSSGAEARSDGASTSPARPSSTSSRATAPTSSGWPPATIPGCELAALPDARLRPRVPQHDLRRARGRRARAATTTPPWPIAEHGGRRRRADRGGVPAAGVPHRPVDGLAHRPGGRLRAPRPRPRRARHGHVRAQDRLHPRVGGGGDRAAPRGRGACRRTSPPPTTRCSTTPPRCSATTRMWERIRPLVAADFEERDGAMLAAQWQACLDYDSSDRLPGCEVPIHAIAFAQDVQTPPARVREVADLRQHGRFHLLEGLGHGSAFGHRPDVVNEALLGILAGSARRLAAGAQLALEHLARRVARQLVHEDDLARHLEAREVGLHVRRPGRRPSGRGPARRRRRRSAAGRTRRRRRRSPRPRRPRGARRAASSTSRGKTFSPPEMIISSSRPATNSRPSSSRWPRSPVDMRPADHRLAVAGRVALHDHLVADEDAPGLARGRPRGRPSSSSLTHGLARRAAGRARRGAQVARRRRSSPTPPRSSRRCCRGRRRSGP